MVEVAQQKASNPVFDAAQSVPILRDLPSSWLPPPKLEIPNKLLIPVYFPVSALIASTESVAESAQDWFVLVGYVMLGLGDIALPALLV